METSGVTAHGDSEGGVGVKIEEAIGKRIQTLRERAGMSQAVFGAHLSQLLTGEWPRQNVYAAERGHRKLGVADLFAMAQVLGVHVNQLLIVPTDVEELEFPAGVTVPVAQLQGPQSGHPAAGNEASELLMLLPKMINDLDKQYGETRARRDKLQTSYERLVNSMGRDVVATEEANA
jgi:transcriptional regulator with XRE-family HTH domain